MVKNWGQVPKTTVFLMQKMHFCPKSDFWPKNSFWNSYEVKKFEKIDFFGKILDFRPPKWPKIGARCWKPPYFQCKRCIFATKRHSISNPGPKLRKKVDFWQKNPFFDPRGTNFDFAIIAPIDIQQTPLNIYLFVTVNISSIRWVKQILSTWKS